MNQESTQLPRNEYLAIAFLTLAAGTLRFYGIQDIGLSHFDAGIYAQSALWPWTGEWYPGQGYYSPPLFPFLWGLFNLTLGAPTDWGGVFISGLAGTALVPATWYLGRQWLGPGGGLTGAALVGFDAMNILFSRIALTDSLFTFLFISTLGVGYGWMLGGGWWRGAAALTISTLCVYTKYNGFMPLYLLLILSFFQKPKIACASRSILLLVSTLITYSPWIAWFHVQHGYASLWEHQSGYLSDPSELSNNYEIFFTNFMSTSFILLPLSFLLLCVAFLLISKDAMVLLVALFSAILSLPGGLKPGMAMLIFAVFVMMYKILLTRLPLFIVAALMTLAPAMYTPYFRLWLPTVVLWFVLFADGLRYIVAPQNSSFPLKTSVHWGMVGIFLFATGFIMWQESNIDRWKFLYDFGYRPHAGYRGAAHQIFEEVEPGEAVFTLTRPSLIYYLRVGGVIVELLDGEEFPLENMQSGEWLFIDRVIDDNPKFRDTFPNQSPEIRLHDNPLLDVDLITLLDAYHGSRPLRDLATERAKERIYLIQKK